MEFHLADRTDVDRLAGQYRRDGAVSIESLLQEDSALALAEYLEGSDRWNEVFWTGGKVNVLRMFAVPQQHPVACVAPYVPHRRLSVTGWLRDRQPG